MFSLRATQNETQKITAHRFAKYLTEKELNLSEQKLSAADIPELIDFVKKNPQIVKVDLSHNALNDSAVTDLMKGCPKIKSLNLSQNAIGIEGAEALAKHAHLIDLNVSNNLITDKGAIEFAKNNKLIKLNLNNCGIKGYAIAEFGNNKQLRHLDISRNGSEKRRNKNDVATLLEKNTTLTKLTLNGYLLSHLDLIAISKNTKRVQLDNVVTGVVADAVEESEWTPIDLTPEAWDVVRSEEMPDSKSTPAAKDLDWDFIKKSELSKSMKTQAKNSQNTEGYFSSWLPAFFRWGTAEPLCAPQEKKEEKATNGLSS